MRIMTDIHSLKDKEYDRHVLGETTINKNIGDNIDMKPSIFYRKVRET